MNNFEYRKLLIDEKNRPIGGKWTYDSENRLKYPTNKLAPPLSFPKANKYYKEAEAYTLKHFGTNPGFYDSTFIYPTTFDESSMWFQNFLKERE